MFEKDLISVILPIYNVAQWLPHCLRSIQANTYKKLEIICINDGSPDNSLEILESFAASDSRIRIISQQNGGVQAARNAGLAAATGEYISFIDPDDWVHERYFEFLYRSITSENLDIAICGHICDTGKTVLPAEVTYGCQTISAATMVSNHSYKIYVWDKLFRHELVRDIRFDRKARFDDTTFVMDVFLHNPLLRVAYVNAPLYAYQIRPGSIISTQGIMGILLFAERFSALLNPEMDPAVANVLAIEASKRALSAISTYLALNDRESVSRCRASLDRCLPYIKENKLRYQLLTRYPGAYRIWRILRDPTMLQYDRSLRQQARKK